MTDHSSSQNPSKKGKFTAADWDKVRTAFQGSIMIETPLTSLAQNLDMPDWPLPGKQETPAKYTDLSFEELAKMSGIEGRPERVDQLIKILKETLAFDQPFEEMVAVTEEIEARDNPILKNLSRLGIPDDYPITLVALTPEAREFSASENLVTLKEFALFAQNISQSVIVQGDFRAFLNALSHLDETTMAQFLPIRSGVKGVHLLEGLALTVRAHSVSVQAALAKHYGARLGVVDMEQAAQIDSSSLAEAEELLRQQTAMYVEYFTAEHAELQRELDAGIPLARLAVVLKDPLIETIVTNLLKPYMSIPERGSSMLTSAPPLDEEPVKKPGFFAKIGRMFRK